MKPFNLMKLLSTTSCFLLTGLISQAMHADELSIGVSQQGDQSIMKPKSGITMDAVRNQYGEPSQVEPAVGDPPITRWFYPEFTVYFEHDRVVHSVLVHKK